MCRRVAFSFAGTTVGSAFDSATRSLLPVRKRSGRDELVLWGRREGEPGSCEQTPTVPVETVKGGGWDPFEPRWVKLYLDRYQVADAKRRLLWHKVPPGGYLQGVLVLDTDPEHTQRVYIASVRVPRQTAQLSADGRWPHVANPNAAAASAAAAGHEGTVVPAATELPDPTVLPDAVEVPAIADATSAEAARDREAVDTPHETSAGAPAGMEDTIELSDEEANPGVVPDGEQASADEPAPSALDSQATPTARARSGRSPTRDQ